MHLKKGSTLEMETSQIKGVDSTIRTTKGVVEEGRNYGLKKELGGSSCWPSLRK